MIHVIGIGPGSPEWLPPAIYQIVAGCDVLIGGSRALELFPEFLKDKYRLSGDLASGVQMIRKSINENKIVGVLVSGDPGFFSLLPVLKREFPEEEILVYPGISSMQFAFARAGIPWQEADFLSVHGRELTHLPKRLFKPLAVLTGGENTPQKVAAYYLELGVNPPISIGKALSYPEEVWFSTDAKSLVVESQDLKNSIMVIYPDFEGGDYSASGMKIGIPDGEFIRGNVPMTKSEIRVQVLAKAQIKPSDNILDVGAGTGSISVEAANLAYKGKVYAVENNPEAQELILANKRKFSVGNLEMVSGTAPGIFAKIPPVDVCIIGGSKGYLQEIIEQAPLVRGGRIVLTAITLETVVQGLDALKKLSYQEIEATSIQAVRWNEVNNRHMAESLNQVFIIAARKGGKE